MRQGSVQAYFSCLVSFQRFEPASSACLPNNDDRKQAVDIPPTSTDCDITLHKRDLDCGSPVSFRNSFPFSSWSRCVMRRYVPLREWREVIRCNSTNTVRASFGVLGRRWVVWLLFCERRLVTGESAQARALVLYYCSQRKSAIHSIFSN